MKIAIIGGGISGLTTALALQKLGIECNVYEQAAELKVVGAGIWIQPNALKVLNWLGLENAIKENGTQLNRVDITDQKLNPIKNTKQEIAQDELGNKIISIHRGRLQKILADGLLGNTINLDCQYQSHSIKDNKVIVQFQNSTIEADLLIAADGIHSKVRGRIFPDAHLRYSGQTAWRGIAKIKLPASLTQIGREAWGKQVRFGFSEISPNEVYWFAVAKSEQNQTDKIETLQEDLLTRFQDFHPAVKDILKNTEIDKIFRSDISDLSRLSSWSHDRVCLIGDAAHATTPNMGQGAGQGIEDAYYLSNILSRTKDYTEAFKKFENRRREKVDYVVNNSWRFGQMAHSTIGQEILKLIMKLTPEKLMIRQMHKLYSIQENF